MLKLTKLLFLLSLILSLASCVDSEGEGHENPDFNPDLLGTWTLVSLEGNADGSLTTNGAETTLDYVFDGSEFNYDLTFTEAAFTTVGSYKITSTKTLNGIESDATSKTYSDITGTGKYTNSETEITIVEGFLFELETDGFTLDEEGEDEIVDYEINADGDLIIYKDINDERDINGTLQIVNGNTESRWTKI